MNLSQFKKKNQKGTLTYLFLGFSFVLIGIMTLSFLVGGAVNKKIQSQQSADSAASSIAAHSSQGLNMIAVNNLGVGASLQINNSLLIVTYYAGIARVFTHSFAEFLTDLGKVGTTMLKNAAGVDRTTRPDELGSQIQKDIFDNIAKAGRIFVASAAGLTKFNAMILENWLSIGPAKSLETGRLNSPGSIAFSFQNYSEKNNSNESNTGKSFSLMKYNPSTSAPALVVSSPQSTICAVTAVKPLGQDSMRDSIGTYLMGPINSLPAIPGKNLASAAGNGVKEGVEFGLNIAKTLVDKLQKYLPVKFGFLKCGIALKSPLYDFFASDSMAKLFTKDGLAGFVSQMMNTGQIEKQPLLRSTNILVNDKFMDCIPDVKDCGCSETKSIIRGTLNTLGTAAGAFIEQYKGGPEKALQADMLYNTWKTYDIQRNAIDKKYFLTLFTVAYNNKNNLKPKPETIASMKKFSNEQNKLKEMLLVPYSKDNFENCGVDAAENPKCNLKFEITKYTHLCPFRNESVNLAALADDVGTGALVGGGATGVGILAGGAIGGAFSELKTALGENKKNGSCFRGILSHRDSYTEHLTNRLEEECKGFVDWEEASKEKENGFMIVNWGCQADAYVNSDPSKDEKCNRGLKNATNSPLKKLTDNKESTLGFTFVKNTPENLKAFQAHTSFRVLLASPDLLPEESKKALSGDNCKNFETSKIDGSGTKKCLLDLSSTYATNFFAKGDKETQGQADARSLVAGGTTRPENEDVWKRMAWSISGSKSVYLAGPTDPSPKAHMELFWPAWSIGLKRAKLSDFSNSNGKLKGTLKWLDEMNGAL